MIKTPLSTVIGGAFWTPGATVINGKEIFSIFVKSLFANGEQGFVYDPNDLSTMFQDAAGTIPVTGAGQPVGLVLDKSKGLAFSAELVTNGDFTNGSAGWTLANGSSVTSSALVLSSQYATADQSHNVLNGDLIELSYSIVEALGTPALFVSGSSYAGSAITLNSSLGTYKVRFRVTDATKPLRLVQNNTGVTLKLDNISVKKVQGNHAYQTTSASRPLLQKDAITGAYYLEFDGADDFLSAPKTNMKFLHNGSGASIFVGYTPLSSVYHVILNTGNLGNAGVVGAVISQDDRVGNGSIFNIVSNGSGTLHVNNVVSTGISTASRVVTVKNIAGSHIVRLNAIQMVSSSTEAGVASQNESTNDLWIGRAPAGFPMRGRIYSLIGVGRITTDSETIAIEKELAKRTGVAL